MKSIFALFLAVSLNAAAETADTTKVDTTNNSKPVFTVIKENPITSIKNQSNSG